ncbi:threonine synthase [Aeromonas rivipollensis]|uniref:Threonine synthase n=1 Tax=Aeromonas rivipollensis TaxID=948519 RepID=A0AAW9Y7A1_9GAMM|nr:threonine synthase [Aeromonas rivipollensis]NEX73450.1 threonine synthase [Aeromonas rivipollensis]
MPYSYLSHLRCSKTGEIHDADQPQQLSRAGAPLLASYDLEALKQAWRPTDLLARPATLWRYHELLPVRDPAQVVTLGEGLTPLLPLPTLGKQIGIPELWMKDESIIPTGSFKARGAAVGISRARELGVSHFAMPTNGNAGAAWALYGARAGLSSTIVMPQAAPAITRLETSLAGSRLYLVDGLISDAGRQVAQAVEEQSLFDASTLKEPYRIEGKKTMGLEIAEQFGWTLPDVILYPTGGGVGLIGIYKALLELQELGWIKGDLPRLVAVQASGCAPIVQAWRQGERESRFWPDSQTLAFGINVPKALGDFLVLDALYCTEGCAIAVDERAITAEIRQLASLEGSFVCPEGAAAFAAARQLREAGWIREGERVVVLNTGAGIKYPDAITVLPQRLRRDGRIPA